MASCTPLDGQVGRQLRKRALREIRQARRLVVRDVAHAQVPEDVEQHLAAVLERNGAMVREVLLDEHVAIEAVHLRDAKHGDAAKRARAHRQDLALGDVAAKTPLAVALQAIEGDGLLPHLRGAELLMSSSVTMSALAHMPRYSESAP